MWHRKDCINCHTLLGEGAYYAPDLTKIAQQRGEPYLRLPQGPSVLLGRAARPADAQPEPDGPGNRDVIAFLTWVSKIDNQGWPPRPILVSAATRGHTLGHTSGGRRIERSHRARPGALQHSPPGCFACHSTQPGV